MYVSSHNKMIVGIFSQMADVGRNRNASVGVLRKYVTGLKCLQHKPWKAVAWFDLSIPSITLFIKDAMPVSFRS